MSSNGHVLKIFVMGGDFEGFQAIELSNWSGKAFLGERSHINLCNKREELNKTGIYLLLSNDQNEDGVFQLYIGETDTFSSRIVSHAKNKKWWDKFIVFTAGDDNLTKAHVRFLERELYKMAQVSGSPVEIMNSSDPGGANLSEAEISFASTFLDNLLFTLKTLGYDYFSSSESKSITKSEEKKLESTGRFYTLQLRDFWKDGKPVKSFMYIDDGKFIVEKNSYIRLNPTESFEKRGGYYKQWQDLVNSNLVQKSDIEGLGIITEDIEFSSASAAGSVVRGKATNGATRWRSCETNKTLKESME